MTYPLETTISEKLETIISRSIANTRLRDYYDIYTLWTLRKHEIDFDLLHAALTATARKRGTFESMSAYRRTMEEVALDRTMLNRWTAYAHAYPYVQEVTLQNACDIVIKLMKKIEW